MKIFGAVQQQAHAFRVTRHRYIYETVAGLDSVDYLAHKMSAVLLLWRYAGQHQFTLGSVTGCNVHVFLLRTTCVLPN